MSMLTLLKDPAGLKYNALAIAYITGTYLFGWYGLFSDQLSLNIVATMALTHSMIIAAYLLHDCGHNAIFRSAQHNAYLGYALNWITGSCYGRYEDIRYKHMRHHVDNCDPVSFDYRNFLRKHPILERLVFALEWAYIPAVEFMMHSMLILAPWFLPSKAKQKTRVARVVIIRGALLIAVAATSLKALLLYALAQVLLLTVLRFMDCYQHNYEVIFNLDDPQAKFPHRGNAEFEQANTYSNLLSRRWPWINLLVLNFCYHNAHHEKPVLGWYRLPALHREMGDALAPQTLSFYDQAKCFHRYRLQRIYAEDYGNDEVKASVEAGKAVGVDALCFLTAF
jgi:omega-6 fatty acid desaturase (delta-12 desaturase)